MKKKFILLLLISIFSVMLVYTAALAMPMQADFSFTTITNNSATNSADAEAQLKLEITEYTHDAYDIQFTFINLDPPGAPMSVTAIYLDDLQLQPKNKNTPAPPEPKSILNYDNPFIVDDGPSSGVSFSDDKVAPPDVPGGSDPNFVVPAFVADYAADSDEDGNGGSGSMINGINPGEHLTIKFNFNDDYTPVVSAWDDLIIALTTGVYRIGMHIQAFGDGGSESVINRRPPEDIYPVPEPTTMFLLGTGLVGVAGMIRRKRKIT